MLLSLTGNLNMNLCQQERNVLRIYACNVWLQANYC